MNRESGTVPYKNQWEMWVNEAVAETTSGREGDVGMEGENTVYEERSEITQICEKLYGYAY